MKLLIHLSLAVLIAALAASTPRASTVTRCPGSEYVAYYVLVNEPVGNAAPIYTQTYIISPNSSPPPVLPTEPRKFDELLMNFNESPVLYPVCSNDIAAFEVVHGIQTGNPLKRKRNQPSELYEVLDESGQRLGVVWRDQFQPFDQGGSIGGQSYWACGSSRTPVINNFAGFSSGLDPAGLNGVDSTEKEQFYFNYIRARFEIVDRRRMEIEGCTAFPSKEAFDGAPNLSDVQIWFRNYDPSSGPRDRP